MEIEQEEITLAINKMSVNYPPDPDRIQTLFYRGFWVKFFPILESNESRIARGDYRSRLEGWRCYIRRKIGDRYTKSEEIERDGLLDLQLFEDEITTMIDELIDIPI